MKRFPRQTLTGFVAGVTVSALTALLISPAAATTMKQIRVAMGDIRIYVDGNLQIPRDANGKQIEPMLYEGTTYLPVRALTGMLTDKPVSWDAPTHSVYIGEEPEASGIQLDTLEPYDESGVNMSTGQEAMFTSLDKAYTPSNRLQFCYGYGNSYITYQLDSHYSKLQGTYLIQHDDWDCDAVYQISICSIDNSGTETELYRQEVTAEDSPLVVKADVTGCHLVKIASEKVVGHSHACTMYDVSLIR